MIKTLGGAPGVQNNYAATVAPTSTADAAQGYAVGSSWLMPATGEMWRARSVTPGAARWIKLDAVGHPGYVAGRFYVPFGQGPPVGGVAFLPNTMVLAFGAIKERVTLSHIGARVTTLASGGNFQLGVYTHNALTAMPGAFVGSTSSGSTAAVGLINAPLGTPATVEPGDYWFGIQVDNTTAIFLSQGLGGSNHMALVGHSVGAITGTPGSQSAGMSVAATFGTWPADLTGAGLTEVANRVPIVQFLVASVP